MPHQVAEVIWVRLCPVLGLHSFAFSVAAIERLRLGRNQVRRVVAAEIKRRTKTRNNHWKAGGKRLGDRQSEAFATIWVNEAVTGGIQSRHLLGREFIGQVFDLRSVRLQSKLID